MHKSFFGHAVFCTGETCVDGCCQDTGIGGICIPNGGADVLCEGIYPSWLHDYPFLFNAV